MPLRQATSTRQPTAIWAKQLYSFTSTSKTAQSSTKHTQAFQITSEQKLKQAASTANHHLPTMLNACSRLKSFKPEEQCFMYKTEAGPCTAFYSLALTLATWQLATFSCHPCQKWEQWSQVVPADEFLKTGLGLTPHMYNSQQKSSDVNTGLYLLL